MSSRQPQHLAVLGLNPGATLAEIRSAYKRLAIQWHPDKNKSDQATSKFQEISHAYSALTDPDYRSDSDNDADSYYNQEGMERFMNLFQAFFGGGGTANFVFSQAPSMVIDPWEDDDDYGFEPEELFPLRLVESTTNSLTIDWEDGLTDVPSGTTFRLDICSPPLPWSACYLGHGRQCTIAGLLPGCEYSLRLGVADDCNRTIDICSEASYTTKPSAEGKRRTTAKIHLVADGSQVDALTYQWNFNRIAVYEKLVIDPDVEMPSPRRFNFGDDDDSFEEMAGSDDLYDEYLMYSDGELADDIFGSSVFTRMNLNSDPIYAMSSDNAPGPARRKLCRFFQQGTCRYGNSCRFSHDPLHQTAFDCDYDDELDSDGEIKKTTGAHAKTAPPACRFFQAGNCRRSNCQFSHIVPANNSNGNGRSRNRHSRGK